MKYEELQKEFPEFYAGVYFECNEGWYQILKTLAQSWRKILKKGKGTIQVAQIKEKFGCYDDQTEVLTENGWKYFKDLLPIDRVATLSEDKYLKYHLCNELMIYPYKGKMYKLKTRGVDLLVTPNHNLYVSKGSYYNGNRKPCKRINNNYELTSYEKFYRKNKRFKKDAVWEGITYDCFLLPALSKEWNRGKYGNTRKHWESKLISIKDWLKFLGWYIAEGCSSYCEITISFCNVGIKGNEKEIVKNIIKNIGYEPKIAMEEKTGAVYKFNEVRLANWLISNCGKLAKNKKVPEFIKELSPELIRVFLEALYTGDGHKAKTSHILTTISKKLADDVQELILKAGNTSNCYPARVRVKSIGFSSTSPVYEINWLKHGDHNTCNKGMAGNSFEGLVDYEGNVYCVNVRNHVIYVRRNGIPVWCGNSLRVYIDTMNLSTQKQMDVATAIDIASTDSVRTCEVCGAVGCNYVKAGWIKTLCVEHAKENKYLEI